MRESSMASVNPPEYNIISVTEEAQIKSSNLNNKSIQHYIYSIHLFLRNTRSCNNGMH